MFTKKIILFAFVIISMLSCTENRLAKSYGGTTTINLPKGEKLIEATWKDANLWYLTEPMEDGYIPRTKMFREDSEFGIMEGTIKFIEHW